MKGAKILLGLLLMAFPSLAADVPIAPTGPVFQLQPAVIWGQSGPQGFNNNFFFTPIALNESVCVFVYNNNTTSAHAFTASIQVTGNPAEVTPSDNTWQNTASSASLTAFASPGLPAGIGGQVSGAAKVSVNFSASTTQAGSPDTASITIVQTPGNCFSGGQMLSSSPGTISAVPPIQAIAEGLSQSFGFGTVATNPVIGQMILNVNANNSSKSIYFDKVVASCSASCTLNFNITSTQGTGCTVQLAVNTKNGSGVASVSQVQQGACTTNPNNVSNIFPSFPLAAGIPTIIDLRGFIESSGTLNGMDVTMGAALTGTISLTFLWYEK